MNYLLSISIGPVQDFIAAARKTRDLWAGSKLLSDISRDAAAALKKAGADLVFPPLSALEDEGVAVANKLVAISTDADPAALAAEARAAAVKRLNTFLGDAKKAAQDRGVRNGIDWALAQKQADGFLEFYAAWWPLADDSPEVFDEARIQVERLLAGRKALRDFAPSNSRAGKPKSSLDPGRDSVLDFTLDEDKLKANRFGIKKGEMLDGVSLAKRVADTQRFVSTARVACDPFVRRLVSDLPDALTDVLLRIGKELCKLDSDLSRAFKGFDQFQDFPYDTQLFWGDAVSDRDATEEEKELAKKFYGAVMEAKRALDIPEPTPYYAILVADGDGMGSVISEVSRTQGRGKLVELSEKLGEFAAKAVKVVEDHQGAPVYVGGDDVMAMLPLDRALECADELRRKFHELLKSFGTGDSKLTLSCGVAIVHYTALLQKAIGWARAAEKDAKQNSGKNALAVHLHTRTAGDDYIRVRHTWKDSEKAGEGWWTQWCKWQASRQLPRQAAYQLRELAREFEGLDEPEALAKEVERIVKRKRSEGGGKDLDPKVAEAIRDAVKDSSGAVTPESLRHAVDGILICRHITTAKLIAGELPASAEEGNNA